MPNTAAFAATAALIADPARAAMLQALLGGQALTAGELARIAGIAASTASAHLARLADGGLVLAQAMGRHRYHRIASGQVAELLERLGGLTAAVAPVRRWPHGEAFRTARLCYDHLAGRLGVALHAAMTGQGWLAPDAGGWRMTAVGAARLAALGVDLAAAAKARHFACDCMDWSERRPHLRGGLGGAVARCCLDHGWLRRGAAQDDDPLSHRRLAITPEGGRLLRENFGIELAA